MRTWAEGWWRLFGLFCYRGNTLFADALRSGQWKSQRPFLALIFRRVPCRLSPRGRSNPLGPRREMWPLLSYPPITRTSEGGSILRFPRSPGGSVTTCRGSPGARCQLPLDHFIQLLLGSFSIWVSSAPSVGPTICPHDDRHCMALTGHRHQCIYV